MYVSIFAERFSQKLMDGFWWNQRQNDPLAPENGIGVFFSAPPPPNPYRPTPAPVRLYEKFTESFLLQINKKLHFTSNTFPQKPLFPFKNAKIGFAPPLSPP